MGDVNIRLGAYVLCGDPVWLRSSLARYYDVVDDLVVLVPRDGLGWTGRKVRVAECLEIVRSLDVRNIVREVEGSWINRAVPMAADTAQRQAGIDALTGSVDWVLQIDNDEVVPDPQALVRSIDRAGDALGVEWPMQVLYRRTGNRFLGVAGPAGQPTFEYPGSVLVRAGSTLTDARRIEGSFVRMVVEGDDQSVQLRRPVDRWEIRRGGVRPDQAIIHNSWGRTPRQVWQKIRSWGHASGLRGAMYYVVSWLPSPLTWRMMRDFHPFARGLWARLVPVDIPDGLLLPEDRVVRRSAWRTRARR